MLRTIFAHQKNPAHYIETAHKIIFFALPNFFLYKMNLSFRFFWAHIVEIG